MTASTTTTTMIIIVVVEVEGGGEGGGGTGENMMAWASGAVNISLALCPAFGIKISL